MPELAELKITANYINRKAADKIFYSIKKNPQHKGKEVILPFEGPFTIEAQSRGKELMLMLRKLNSDQTVKLLMTMGMSGHFKWFDAGVSSKHSHLKFSTEGGSLDFVDIRRFGKWKIVEDWSKDRGPDPTSEFEKFVHHIGRHMLSKDFKKPIYEVLMNQKYFNGIGNYLRAEILYRADVNPFISTFDAIQNSDVLLLCKYIPLEAYQLGGGSIKDWQNPFNEPVAENWDQFMKCYGNKQMSQIMDRNGRRFWYDPKWNYQDPEMDYYSGLPNLKAYEAR